MDPFLGQITIAFLTGGVALEVVKAIVTRWQQAIGKKEQAATQYNKLMEACLVARAVAIKLGATEKELGPIPE